MVGTAVGVSRVPPRPVSGVNVCGQLRRARAGTLPDMGRRTWRRVRAMSNDERAAVAERMVGRARWNLMWMRRQLVAVAIVCGVFGLGVLVLPAGHRPAGLRFGLLLVAGGVLGVASLLVPDPRLKRWLTGAALACPAAGFMVF